MLAVGRLRQRRFFDYRFTASGKQNRYSMTMAKSQASEIFTTLKSYAQKLSDGERTPAEVATALNEWAKESAESVKVRIHDEVEAAVEKMGFVKREEFDALVAEVNSIKSSSVKKPAMKKTSVKKSAVRKVAAKKRVVKK